MSGAKGTYAAVALLCSVSAALLPIETKGRSMKVLYPLPCVCLGLCLIGCLHVCRSRLVIDHDAVAV